APAPVVVLEHPLSEERSVLRTSLLPGLLEALRRARHRGERNVRLFSVGAVFLPPNPQAHVSPGRPRQGTDSNTLPEERLSFAAVLAGARPEYLSLKPPEVEVYDAKGIAVELVERITRQTATVVGIGASPETPHLHPRGAAKVL